MSIPSHAPGSEGSLGGGCVTFSSCSTANAEASDISPRKILLLRSQITKTLSLSVGSLILSAMKQFFLNKYYLYGKPAHYAVSVNTAQCCRRLDFKRQGYEEANVDVHNNGDMELKP